MAKSRKSKSNPTTRGEFMVAVDGERLPGLRAAQENLLTALESLHFVKPTFDACGENQPSYNVRRAGIPGTILRVRANGKIQAGISGLHEAGLPTLADFFKRQIGHLIKPDADKWPWLQDNIVNLDVAEIAEILRALAEEAHWNEPPRVESTTKTSECPPAWWQDVIKIAVDLKDGKYLVLGELKAGNYGVIALHDNAMEATREALAWCVQNQLPLKTSQGVSMIEKMEFMERDQQEKYLKSRIAALFDELEEQ